ncbi:MAG: hypothetical protein HC900_00195 [Methylacidiphilales bacterium]|nr:hypothetical protein [Candidatus Methylacidiphilales bacterium]
MTEQSVPKPGLYDGISEYEYRSGPGISKSGLWTIWTRSPAHFRFAEPKESEAFDFGSACHLAILQPNEFEQIVHRGPPDRRGNKWTDLAKWCEAEGKLLLTEGDFEKCLTIRDALHADAWISGIITGGARHVEASAYWMRDGLLCKCRPDLYRRDLGIILDLKSTACARGDAFARSVVDYGYHVQEQWYSDGLASIDLPVNGFAFLAFEKEAPFAFRVYELPPPIVAEGHAIADQAFARYAECVRANIWPAYGYGVEELSFPRWAYKATPAPMGEDA